ncbi:DegT/DnrJ/EryC1/StrS family aminotransferase [Haloplanus aerogenes]|uniref:DegT/DnrJ/EryC1/StrS family aminotransferase n=1 Tax=Haloplanus aerogenes TaxID=660522 RepID=A0A3M0DPN2_9EURY|nr:DegT/DnrJ/EryC1/StrS family aminotransferase [Haloplanus aerogenes]AZH24761.1 DegT/DnrJ/EryC1/StrS family aminotransferase [Haloplanus aerogenes]RMB23575.1 dTDP-4-amino-4,6-dideoxygalactose transaminase [Haloplanus aerogenes]
MTIPIANPTISEKAKARVEAVLDSGMIADGPEVRKFEDEFADYCEVEYGVATANGTAALHAALEALGIGEGDTVLTTPLSFVATANAIRFTGAKPVFADINPETYNLDPDAATTVARKHDVDAIMPVHLYGLPVAMNPIQDLASDLDIPIVEDAAQAHGATYGGDPVGSLGDVACFSFYPTKNMTTGEGGMIVTNRDDIFEAASQFVNHGRTESYEHAMLGHNFRMTSMAAAIGRVQLDRLPEFIETRRENAAKLTEGLTETSVATPTEPDGLKHVYHQYTIRTDSRDELQDHLDDHGVGNNVYYPKCIHEQPAYDGIKVTAPKGEAAAMEVLSLPVHPSVSADDRNWIIESIQDYDTE